MKQILFITGFICVMLIAVYGEEYLKVSKKYKALKRYKPRSVFLNIDDIRKEE